MIDIIKTANQILEKREKKEIKENSKDFYLINLAKLLKKYPSKIYYKNIDYITCEVKTLNTNILNIVSSFLPTYNHDRDIDKHIGLITDFQTIPILDKFYLVKLGLIFGGQLDVYGIYDINCNKIGSFIYKLPGLNKRNCNAITSLELSGLFFKCYQKYFDDILFYFGIDRDINGVLKRLDYCVDIIGIEVHQLLKYLKDIHKKGKVKNYEGLTATDLQKLREGRYEVGYGLTVTGKKFISTSNTLTVYDKILDIVKNYMKRKVEGVNPYQDYLDSNSPITRIELKKVSSAFADINDNSINNVLKNIEARYFDYLKRYFICDFSLFVGQNISLNGKKDFLAKKEKHKKILHSFTMAKAYLKNIEEYTSKDELFKFIFELYPELEGRSSLDFMDEFEKYEFVRDLFP